MQFIFLLVHAHVEKNHLFDLCQWKGLYVRAHGVTYHLLTMSFLFFTKETFRWSQSCAWWGLWGSKLWCRCQYQQWHKAGRLLSLLCSLWAASSPAGPSINRFPSTSGVICLSVQSCCAHRWTWVQCQGGGRGQVRTIWFCAVFCTSGDVRISMSCSMWIQPNAMNLESLVCLALLL